MLCKYIPKLGFASSKDIAGKTFQIFSQRYAANVEAFKKRVGEAADQAETIKKSTQRAYVHPLHETYKPVFLGVADTHRV